MPPKYSFSAQQDDWPTDKPAKRSIVRIEDKQTGSTTELVLSPAESRALARTALRALAFTKVSRADGQWEQTWVREIDEKIEPILTIVNAILPRTTRKKTAGNSA